MAEILQAADFQAPDDPAITLAESREGRISKSVKIGLAAISQAMAMAPIATMVGSHNAQGIGEIIGGPTVHDALKQAYKPVAETFVEAAEMQTAEALGRALVVYDPLAAAGQLAGAQQTFIGSILGQSAETVRQQLVQGLRLGAQPEKIAEALKAVVGLTPRQAQAVSNFRRLLEQGDLQALTRALRDSRFDATVRSWADGAPVDPKRVDAMVERYAARSLQHRADTIARNESLKATTGGIRDAYVQAIGSGRLLESEVTRKWRVVFDERLCPICASIPLLNPLGVGVMQPYLSAAGPIMAPLAHVNCRCTESYKTDLSRVTANPFSGKPAPGVWQIPAPAPAILLN